MSPVTTSDNFAQIYVAAWSTKDADERRELVAQLYAEDAEFFAEEPGDEPVLRRGREEILNNITEVNERLTQRAGLSTSGTGVAQNHDLLRVSWQMSTADGQVAMTGMNVLTRDASGAIVRDYIFIR